MHRDFDDALSDLSDWGSSLSDPGLVLLTNPSVFLAGASYALYEALPEERVAFADSPVLYDKSIKNQVGNGDRDERNKQVLYMKNSHEHSELLASAFYKSGRYKTLSETPQIITEQELIC